MKLAPTCFYWRSLYLALPMGVFCFDTGYCKPRITREGNIFTGVCLTTEEREEGYCLLTLMGGYLDSCTVVLVLSSTLLKSSWNDIWIYSDVIILYSWPLTCINLMWMQYSGKTDLDDFLSMGGRAFFWMIYRDIYLPFWLMLKFLLTKFQLLCIQNCTPELPKLEIII